MMLILLAKLKKGKVALSQREDSMQMLVVFIAACISSFVAMVVALQRGFRTSPIAKAEDFLALGASPQLAYYLAKHDRLNAVKTYRTETGLALREAVVYVDGLTRRVRG